MITLTQHMIPGSDRHLGGEAGGMWVSCKTGDSKTQQHDHTGAALKREESRGSVEVFKDQRGREGIGFLPLFPFLTYLRSPLPFLSWCVAGLGTGFRFRPLSSCLLLPCAVTSLRTITDCQPSHTMPL